MEKLQQMLEEEGVKSKGRIAKVTKTNASEHDKVKKATMRKMKSKSNTRARGLKLLHTSIRLKAKS